MKATRSLQELAMEAVNVQNACNLCGVAQAFARAMVELSAHVNGTDELNAHPISMLWADKIAHLTGTQHVETRVVSDAYASTMLLAAFGKVAA